MQKIFSREFSGFVGKLKVLVAMLLIGGGGGAIGGWYSFYAPNVNPKLVPYDLMIPNGAGYDFVIQTIESEALIKDMRTFELTASLLKYPQLVKPGKYTLKKGMSNLKLIRKLRSGDQDPIDLRFGAHYDKKVLADEVAKQMAFDNQEFRTLITNADYLTEIDMTPATVAAIFIPNTYQVYYTSSPKEIMVRMKSEYDKFWGDKRRAKAKAMGMSPQEVVTLASIVQAESYMADERPQIAGVYLNRLKKGMKLQADPTVIFANQDFTIRRVLNKHLKKDSPYNTYMYRGLPPGPINNPEISAIDAVLNSAKHDFIFFCAKADFSGYHSFSKTLSQHNRYAKLYHRALNVRKKKKK